MSSSSSLSPVSIASLLEEIGKHFNRCPGLQPYSAEQEEYMYRSLLAQHWANEAAKALAAFPRLLSSCQAALVQQREVLNDLIVRWRAQASSIDTYHATMAIGYKAAAGDLEKALSGAGAHPADDAGATHGE